MFSEVVIVLEDDDIHELFQRGLFGVVRRVHEVKPFRLVFSLEIWEGERVYITESLKRYVDAEVVKGRLEFLPCPPVIVSNTRATRYRFA